MIEGNVIKFGYGDISVGADVFTSIIRFRQVLNPLECGDTRYSMELDFTDNNVSIQINDFNEYYELSKSLNEVEKRNLLQFTFKDYIFDFSNYNEKSIIVVKRYLEMAVVRLLQFTAV